MNSQKNQTKLLVQDYITWRLTKAGYHHWHLNNKINLEKNGKNKLYHAMRLIAFRFEQIHNLNEANKCKEIKCQIEPSLFNCKDTFDAIAFKLFTDYDNNKNSQILLNKFDISDYKDDSKLNNLNNLNFNCSWGRIIAIFSYSSTLAIECYENHSPNLVYTIMALLSDFLINNKHIYSWIEAKGSWVTI
jgi:hypothetical protein